MNEQLDLARLKDESQQALTRGEDVLLFPGPHDTRRLCSDLISHWQGQHGHEHILILLLCPNKGLSQSFHAHMITHGHAQGILCVAVSLVQIDASARNVLLIGTPGCVEKSLASSSRVAEKILLILTELDWLLTNFPDSMTSSLLSESTQLLVFNEYYSHIVRHYEVLNDRDMTRIGVEPSILPYVTKQLRAASHKTLLCASEQDKVDVLARMLPQLWLAVIYFKDQDRATRFCLHLRSLLSTDLVHKPRLYQSRLQVDEYGVLFTSDAISWTQGHRVDGVLNIIHFDMPDAEQYCKNVLLGMRIATHIRFINLVLKSEKTQSEETATELKFVIEESTL